MYLIHGICKIQYLLNIGCTGKSFSSGKMSNCYTGITASFLLLSVVVPSLGLQIRSWHSMCVNSFCNLPFLKLSKESTICDVYSWLGKKQMPPVHVAWFIKVFTRDRSWRELDFLVLNRAVGVMIIWVEAGMIFHLVAQLYNPVCAHNSYYGIY